LFKFIGYKDILLTAVFVEKSKFVDKSNFVMSKNIQFIFNPSELGAGTFGASLGPAAIQTAARKSKNDFFGKYTIQEIEHKNYLLDRPTAFQYAKRIDGVKEVASDLSKMVASALNNDSFPLVVSGDHSSGAFTIAGIRKAFPTKRLGVIWIDAHGDLHSPFTTPSGNLHGMPLAIALGEDNLDMQKNEPDERTKNQWGELQNLAGVFPMINPTDLVFVGVRDTEKEEDFLTEKHGIRNVRVEEVRKNGVEQTLVEINQRLKNCDILYVSFDVDSMDPDQTSYGTGTPVKNGLTIQEANDLLVGLANEKRTTCIEVVEVNPCLDNKVNRMAEITFELIQSLAQTIENN
jgi:arginase